MKITEIKIAEKSNTETKVRVYFFHKEGSTDENRKQFRKMMPHILALAGLEGQKFSWSKSAGCTACPCSPGFIVDAVGPNIFVDVTS